MCQILKIPSQEGVFEEALIVKDCKEEEIQELSSHIIAEQFDFDEVDHIRLFRLFDFIVLTKGCGFYEMERKELFGFVFLGDIRIPLELTTWYKKIRSNSNLGEKTIQIHHKGNVFLLDSF